MTNQLASGKKFIDRAADKQVSLISGNIVGGGLSLAVKVPERYKGGIAILAKIGDEAFAEVYEAVKNAPKALPTRKELVASVLGNVKMVGTEEEAKSLLEFLTSIYQVRSRGNIPVEAFASDIYDAIQKENWNVVPSGQASSFKARVAKFLSLDSLNVVALKAKELQTDVERAFCDARILTDLRPIFGNDISEPKAMIVVHTLKLAYHDAATGDHKELFVAIDDEDIAKLKEMLVRAEVKAKVLASRLQAAGIKAIDIS